MADIFSDIDAALKQLPDEAPKSGGLFADVATALDPRPQKFRDQDAKLDAARTWAGGKLASEGDVGSQTLGGVGVSVRDVAENAIPLVSAYVKTSKGRYYQQAVDAYKKGEATDEQLGHIAEYELQQNRQRSMGVGRSALQTAIGLPALVGETALTGPVAGLAGKSILGSEAAATVAGKALQGAATPALTVPEAQQRATEQGGDWWDSKNLAPAAGMAAIKNVILGTVGSQVGKVGANLPARTVAAAALGIGENQVGDAFLSALDEVLPDAYKTKTNWGTIGHALRGERGEAWKSLASDAVAFGVFGALHGREADPVQKLAEASDALTKSGLTPEASARVIQEAVGNPDSVEPGPIKDLIHEQNKAVDPLERLSDKEIAKSAKQIGMPVEEFKAFVRKQGFKPEAPETVPEAPPASPEAQTAPEDAGQEIAPPAAGNVRFYHGGTDYEGGSRWLTPDRAYAEGYAAKNANQGAKTHYVDLPENHPLVRANDQAEELLAGTNMTIRPESRYRAFDAPEELAKGLKPLPPAKPQETGRPDTVDLVAKAGLGGRLNEEASVGRSTPGSEASVLHYGDQEVTVRQAGPDAISINFGPREGEADVQGVRQSTPTANSTAIIRDLSKIASAAADKGLSIRYDAEPKRHEMYSRRLEKAGFEKVGETREGDGKDVLVHAEWAPKEKAQLLRGEHPILKREVDARELAISLGATPASLEAVRQSSEREGGLTGEVPRPQGPPPETPRPPAQEGDQNRGAEAGAAAVPPTEGRAAHAAMTPDEIASVRILDYSQVASKDSPWEEVSVHPTHEEAAQAAGLDGAVRMRPGKGTIGNEPGKTAFMGKGVAVPEWVAYRKKGTEEGAKNQAGVESNLPAPPQAQEAMRGGVPGNPGDLNGPPPKEFALAREAVTAERARRGEQPVLDAVRRSNPEAWDQAHKQMQADPNAGAKLVDRLEVEPRLLADADVPLLLLHRVALSNAHEKAVTDLLGVQGQFKFEAGKLAPAFTEAQIEPYRRAMEDAAAARNRLDEVTRSVGTQLGRGLQFFRQLAKEDYSLSDMLHGAEVAKRAPLTDAEVKQITDMQKRIEELEGQLEKLRDKGGKTPDGKDEIDTVIERDKKKKEYEEWIDGWNRKNRPVPQKVISAAVESSNAVRAFITAYDLSATLRQGGLLTAAHPLKGAKAFGESVRALFNSHEAARQAEMLKRRPTFDLFRKEGGYISDHEKPEESFAGRWVKKIPGVAASERAYNSYLNRLRMDVFDSLVNSSRGGRPTRAEAAAAANLVNVFTGRGTTPQSLDGAMRAAAHVFFSPRYALSRFQAILGQPLVGGRTTVKETITLPDGKTKVVSRSVPVYGGSNTMRAKIAAEYGRSVAGLAAMYGIAAALLPDEKLSFDPRSADFGKMVIGNTRLDPLAGLSQATVFLARVGWGQTKNEKGQVSDLRHPKYGGASTGDVAGRFTRNKLAPIPGAIATHFLGNRPGSGKAFKSTQEEGLFHLGQMVPIQIQDTIQGVEDQGVPRGVAVAMLAALGWGTQVYDRKK